jgi:hypothetical protein
VKRYGYEVAVAVAVGEELPESEKNAVAMGIRPPLSKALSVFFFGFLYFSFVSAVLQAKRVYRWAELGC